MRPERLDRLLSRLGYGSRKEVARWVRAGRITVNGAAAARADIRVRAHEVRLNGEPLDAPGPLAIVMHKPAGLVCDRTDALPNVFGLLPARWLARRPPISVAGRLDRDATGLLILTDDGALNHRLTHPRGHVVKRYRVRHAGTLPPDAAARMRAGIPWPGERRPLAGELTVLGDGEAELALASGRHHQVKRMFAALGCEVLALTRIAVGGLRLDALELAPGAWRAMTPEDLEARVRAETTANTGA